LASSQGIFSGSILITLAPHEKAFSDPETIFRLSEAESIFSADSLRNSKDPLMDDVVAQFGDSACFALQILARICAASERGGQVRHGLLFSISVA
jgi:hypothetical protein